MGTGILALLNVISTILAGRGHDDMAEYVGLARNLIREGSDVSDALQALADELQTMVDEDRDPTEFERATVRDKREELSTRIQAAAGDPAD